MACGMTVALRGGGDTMTTRVFETIKFAIILAIGLLFLPWVAAGQSPAPELRLTAARVSLAGTSNIHPFTASTTDVRMTRLVIAPADGDRLQAAVKPGAVEAFDIVIKAATLTSPKDGLDKNMHKALKVTEFPEITFKLTRLDAATAVNTMKATGTLKIAGVEKPVTFDVKTAVNAAALTVTGDVPMLMTDYGIKPPTAMLGMLKTDPKITVTFELTLALPQTTY
jgi:hypothetical protein